MEGNKEKVLEGKTQRAPGSLSCFRGLSEENLALVGGCELPGLIPILVYYFWNCKNFLQKIVGEVHFTNFWT